MDRKALFGHNISGDNSLYNGNNFFKKLSLDTRKKDLAGETDRLWFSSQEDLIIKHILKISKNNRFSDWRRLPFVWKPCKYGDEIVNDETMGIPSSIPEFLELSADGRYDRTVIKNITFRETKTTRENDFPYKIEHKDGSTVTDEDQLMNKFCKFL